MRRSKRFLFVLGATAAALLLFVVLGEILFRLLIPGYLAIRLEERNLAYDHHPRLGWFPKAGDHRSYTAARTIEVRHNRLGFRDDDWGPKSRPRVLVLGDSFVWGYDVEEDERFTELLSARLPGLQVLNLGVSGYGTDQEYLILQSFFGALDPDFVLLIFCTDNDIDDNSRNATHGGFYKPYFLIEDGELRLSGIPVEKSINYYYESQRPLFHSYVYRALAKTYFKLTRTPYVRNPDPTEPLLLAIQRFLESRGTGFAIGFQEEHAELNRFCDLHGIPYVNLDNAPRYKGHGRHWTPEGHSFLAQRLHELLVELGWVESPAVELGPVPGDRPVETLVETEVRSPA